MEKERMKGVCMVKEEFAQPIFAPDPESVKSKTDDRDGGDKRKFHKKNRGQNKKRKLEELGMPAFTPREEMLCPFLAQDKECEKIKLDKCSFSHDIPNFVKNRAEKDLSGEGVLVDCPRFEKTGKCNLGHKCLVGKNHTKQNVESTPDSVSPNIVNEELSSAYNEKVQNGEVFEEIKPDASFLFSLRKKKFDYTQEYIRTECQPIDFTGKIYVAPLTTLGNQPFRRILKSYGADITCGEMCLARELLTGKSSEWALTRRHSTEDIFGVQITDSDPEVLAKTVKLFDMQQGVSNKVDFVDFNLGCPIDLVTGYGAGSALMNREGKLTKLCASLSDMKIGLNYGIKMRTGWANNKNTAHKLIKKICGGKHDGLNYFCVHGRSRQQRYTKLADWEYVYSCRESIVGAEGDEEMPQRLPGVNLIGNGDILTHIDWQNKVLSNPSADTGMLARGALIKPWLPTEIKNNEYLDISSNERFEILKQFCKNGLEHWGSDERGVATTRKFLLEWMSFLWRYVPVGVIYSGYLPQKMNDRPQRFIGRNDLETLLGSPSVEDWIKISEMILGKVHEGFKFLPKHKANAYQPVAHTGLDEIRSG